MDYSITKFHHVGIAVDDLENSISLFKNIGFTTETKEITDEIQGIKLIFMTNHFFRIELIANLDDSKMISPWLKTSKIRPYHFAYLVSDLFKSIQYMTEKGFKLIKEPVTAKAFGGRLIAFLISKELFMVELIEDIGAKDV